jgi:hypothetical protein
MDPLAANVLDNVTDKWRIENAIDEPTMHGWFQLDHPWRTDIPDDVVDLVSHAAGPHAPEAA